mmetsp:Transcript_10936/g.16358  ORF Transcript_10936/g.16358 Transcript_10936/m.16358 type:complete len:268 (+) Transcript_10936:214-1017(+)
MEPVLVLRRKLAEVIDRATLPFDVDEPVDILADDLLLSPVLLLRILRRDDLTTPSRRTASTPRLTCLTDLFNDPFSSVKELLKPDPFKEFRRLVFRDVLRSLPSLVCSLPDMLATLAPCEDLRETGALLLTLTDDLIPDSESAIDAWVSLCRRDPVTLSSSNFLVVTGAFLVARGASSSSFAEPGFFHSAASSAMIGLTCFSCASNSSMSFISSISPLILRTYVTLMAVRQHHRAATPTPTNTPKLVPVGASSGISVAIMASSRAWA